MVASGSNNRAARESSLGKKKSSPMLLKSHFLFHTPPVSSVPDDAGLLPVVVQWGRSSSQQELHPLPHKRKPKTFLFFYGSGVSLFPQKLVLRAGEKREREFVKRDGAGRGNNNSTTTTTHNERTNSNFLFFLTFLTLSSSPLFPLFPLISPLLRENIKKSATVFFSLRK